MANDTAILRIELLSAATFGRGDGIAGLVDREIENDDNGFPFLRGRTLKGLLNEAAEDLVFALGPSPWRAIKDQLFGVGGSALRTQGKVSVGDARLPRNVRSVLLNAVEQRTLCKEDIFAALTGIRRQTAMNEYGAPEQATLRSMRVVVRGTLFESELAFRTSPGADDWALLAGSALGLRAAGTGRNRGRGRVRATLVPQWQDEAQNNTWLQAQLTYLTGEERDAGV